MIIVVSAMFAECNSASTTSSNTTDSTSVKTDSSVLKTDTTKHK